MASLPSGVEIERARTNAAVRAEARAEAQARCDEAGKAAAVAAAAQHRAAGALDAEAAERGVAAFARDPERLAEVSRSYFRAADGLVSAVREAARAREAVERAVRAVAETEERAAGSRAEAERADVEAAEARARADALRDASGRARDEVLAALGEAREAFERLRQERRGVAEEKSEVDERVGVARTSADAAEQSVAGAEETRKGAAGSLRSLAETALLAAAGFPAAEPPEAWSFTTALELARRVDAEVEEGASAEERNAAEDRLMRRQADLALQLPVGVRIIPSRAGDVLSYQFTWNGRTRAAPEVLAEIAADVAARAALLGEEESRLLEQFLSGEAHDHLASRLRQARALVDRMNAALEQRTTAAGAQVRLAWRIDDAGAQAEAAAAVPLFFRASELLTDANRSALRTFLEQRLAVARDAESERSLQERLLDVLDYRKWHRFQVEHRAPNQAWAPLTRKAHAAGSGGKKAVMLHLPLFAAAAAFYDSAARTAPRVIALDEAFAGIDRPTRGKLMGLLAEFDLDFVMTSFEEWGFYEELDGISTYHLSREPGVRGVFAEWFVWNGRERVLVEES
jgi:hypothetical protein